MRITISHKCFDCISFSFQTAVVPWCRIATNPAFLAILVAHFCVNWVLYALVTSIPIFMKTVLKYDIKSVSIIFYVIL